MFSHSSWFSIRKYGGWGLTPNCWQGWLYLALVIIPFVFLKNQTFLIVWSVIVIVDFLIIFFNLKKDERESLHESIADRNALWMIILVLVLGMVITQTVDPVIIIALVAGAIVKTITSLYLNDK